MNIASYDCIDKYIVSASCREPMHVGSASGDKSEVLIHPVKDIPFIQSTGICGAIRGYCEAIAGKDKTDLLFGRESESRVKVSDGEFEKNKELTLEIRPRVKIDPETGTVSAAKLKGEGQGYSGQKFDMQYVTSGASFSFELILYGADEAEKGLILKALAAMNEGELQLGGQKSNGCGYLDITKVQYGHYDMAKSEDRRAWISEVEPTGGWEEKQPSIIEEKDRQTAFEIVIKAKTEGELLVKGIAVDTFGKDAPNAKNIQNADGKYIIPGSSFKGAIRNRMEMIAEYMHLNSSLIDKGFGKSSTSEESGMIGNLKFRDIVVYDSSKNDNSKLRTRIHIDKFTGGVINGALFKDLNVFGDLEIRIQITNRNQPEAVTGLLILALRDLGRKMYALGSGQSVGKGFIDIECIRITDLRDSKECYIDQDFVISDKEGQKILEKCMEELNKQINKTVA